MPRGKQIAPKTDKWIANVKPDQNAKLPKMHAVGGAAGLYLQVSPSGAKSWLARVSIGGKRREVGLGSYPEVSTAEARETANAMRADLRRGVNPIAERNAAAVAASQVMTFGEATEQFLKVKLQEFDNEKHRKQWRATLDAYAVPVLGKKSVADISVQDVLLVMTPIWTTKNETARRLRGRVEMVLSWATTHGYRTGDNPARWKGNLDTTLQKPSKVAKVTHHPALSLPDAADWMADLRKRDGTASRALEFAALTAARSGEVRGMVWDEVKLDARVWTIPADRMKTGKEHRVPLSDDALTLLASLPRGDSPFVFPAQRGGQLSDAGMSACMKRIHAARPDKYVDARSGRPAVPHGLRSTFRDWAAEKGIERDIAEMALAHVVGSDVERAYRRTDMMERRRNVMAAWAGFLRGETGEKTRQNVVAIR